MINGIIKTQWWKAPLTEVIRTGLSGSLLSNRVNMQNDAVGGRYLFIDNPLFALIYMVYLKLRRVFTKIK